MNVIPTKLTECLLLEPKVFGDSRGYFKETYRQSAYAELGMPEAFVQDNVSFSARGVLRGLHFQSPYPQGKLVHVLQGEIYDVALDVRVGSPTFGQWEAVSLSDENHRQFWVPAGFAHGFCVVSQTALVQYKCSDYYHPETEGSVLWNDPELAIPWPLKEVDLSQKDRAGLPLSQIPKDRLPQI